MQKYSDFLQELVMVKHDVDQELYKRKAGIAGDGTVGQLELALDELNTLESLLKNDQIPPKGKRWLEIAWHITDSWDDKSILGEKILKLVNYYQDKLD